MKSINIIPIMTLLCVGFSLQMLGDYDKNWSVKLQGYSVITHCDKDLVLNWNCKACTKF